MSDALTQDDALLTAIDFVYFRAMAEQLSAVVLLGNEHGGSGGFVGCPRGGEPADAGRGVAGGSLHECNA